MSDATPPPSFFPLQLLGVSTCVGAQNNTLLCAALVLRCTSDDVAVIVCVGSSIVAQN